MRIWKSCWVLPLCVMTACATVEELEDVEPDQPVLEPAIEPVAASEILYAPRVLARALDEVGEEAPPPDEIDREPGQRISFSDASASPAWNSRLGRAEAEALLAIDGAAELEPRFTVRASGDLCTTAEYMTGNENLKLKPDGPRLKAPATVFATAADARAFLATVRAHQPMYLPYRHPDVHLGHGWIYDGGGSHRGQDYSRSGVDAGDDPTFAVRAVAPGKVVSLYWGGAGNGVAIEHTAPDGFKFLTVYYHLRNGKDHDLAKALALDCSQSSDSRCPKYKLFAQKYPNHVSWGTNAHTLKVKLGDTVHAGQQIGWAGNTGPGGAGNGLNDDGSPKSPRGNVHLHTYWGAQHPTEANTFIHIDPYGVYNKENTGCYDLLEDTLFARVVAPFYENFHDLPLEVLSTYFSYYSQMGMSPRTLSVHRDGLDVKSSGSFQRGIPGGWYTRLYMTEAQFQSRFNEYYAKGMIPRETTVTSTYWGTEPRYTATFRPLASGEGFEHRGRMTGSVFQQKWNALVESKKWRVADYFGYSLGGTNYQSALFSSKEGRPFYLWTNRTFSDLKAKIAEGFQNGLAPVSVSASELDGATRYNAILMPRPGCWHWYVGLSKDSYQATWSSLSARGYRLEKVQGYDGSDRYAAVFTLASGATPAVCP
jgi:murein DD-endopeptidase MepM/ murein hydrolase activator NlpD